MAKMTCHHFSQMDEGGVMVLGDCVRDRCAIYDKENAQCSELTQAQALAKLASCVRVTTTSTGEEIPRLLLEEMS